MNKIELTSFADLAADKRKVKEVFFNQINSIINWEEDRSTYQKTK